MVNFNKLRKQQRKSVPLDPGEIFLRLPKAPGFDDLWRSQAEALQKWHKRRTERDVVIKLNTGGGKTMVGLLIAQSILNELKGPVVYLCPTAQLQDQILTQAGQYGIQAVPYTRGGGNSLSSEFLSGNAIMVATYHALFNGHSRFGVYGMPNYVELKGIIFDDAHTAFSNMREIFSLSIEKEHLGELYREFTTLFRDDFAKQSRLGTYDDVVSGRDYSILEVPYISWADRSEEVRQRLSEKATEEFPFVWPLIRDSFKQCHALISKDRFVITPFYPMVDLFPSFTNCPRRVYMSATVADDSSIIRTFDAEFKSVSNPISPTSLAGVGERMILIPDLTRMRSSDVEMFVKSQAKSVARDAGVVILTSSRSSSKKWSKVATIAHGDAVAPAVSKLVRRTTNGPYVFPNRYDGIDLPANSCRLLILSGLPYGSNTYDLYRATVLHGSGAINATLAQQIEQGMGRGTRGGGDHCVVVLMDKDLVRWVSLEDNLKLLTNTTQAQVHLGITVSEEIKSANQLADTIRQCLDRSPAWTEFHADTLAEATSVSLVDKPSLQIAATERRYFAQMRNGYFGKAITTAMNFVDKQEDLDPAQKGLLLELAARAAHQWQNPVQRDKLQNSAYQHNKSLCRPVGGINYAPLSPPTTQAEAIVDRILSFALRQGVVAELDQIASHLVPTATSNQFEEALKNLGIMLGFSAERPDNEQDKGPDVLWLLDNHKAWVIEAKSQKKAINPLTKAEHGQLLQAYVWFKTHYEGLDGVGVVVHPNTLVTDSVTSGETMALTLPKLNEMVGSFRKLLGELTSEPNRRAVLLTQCESRLRDMSLDPNSIAEAYLLNFDISS